jgi:hypothetical protein
VQLAQAGSAGRYVTATLEHKDTPAPADLDNEIGWNYEGDALLSPTAGSGSDMFVEQVLWTGSIQYTTVPGRRYRIVVREFEMRTTDADAQFTLNDGTWAGMGGPNRRDPLVYSDIINFP